MDKFKGRYIMLGMANKEKKIIETFGENVRKKRKALKFTSEALAERAGISYSWVSEIENFHAEGVSLDIAYRVAKALNTTVDELLEEEIDLERTIEQLKRSVGLHNKKAKSA